MASKSNGDNREIESSSDEKLALEMSMEFDRNISPQSNGYYGASGEDDPDQEEGIQQALAMSMECDGSLSPQINSPSSGSLEVSQSSASSVSHPDVSLMTEEEQLDYVMQISIHEYESSEYSDNLDAKITCHGMEKQTKGKLNLSEDLKLNNTNEDNKAPSTGQPTQGPPVLPPKPRQPTQGPPVLPPKPERELARVMFPYSAEHKYELELKEGDVITVLCKELEDKGGWLGESNGKVGFFPGNFVQLFTVEQKETKPELDSDNDDDCIFLSCLSSLKEVAISDQKPLKLWNQGKLYIEVLEQVLLRPDIADLPVVILAVGGEYRTGKSFLLCYILRYLRYLDCRPNDKKQKVSNDWIGDPSDPLQGFQYKNTGVPVTTGIDIWSEPFVIENEGKKVAIILMDTQGIFDNEHTEEESNFIFSFSMMVSSVFVFNIPRNLNDRLHIERLKKFTDYAKECQADNSQKDFQKLMFLVRDWANPAEYGFGIDGGYQMLAKYLKKDFKDLRMFIRDTWEDIDCYLMPHPGFDATELKDFDGNFAGLRKEFQSHLKKLIEELLSPDKLVTKKIYGSEITAAQLYLHIKSSEEHIDNFMKVKTSFICDQARINAYTEFRKKMTDFVGSPKLLSTEREFQDESDKLYKMSESSYTIATRFCIPAQFPDIVKEKEGELMKECLTIKLTCLDILIKKTEKKTGDSKIQKMIKMAREQPWWKSKKT